MLLCLLLMMQVCRGGARGGRRRRIDCDDLHHRCHTDLLHPSPPEDESAAAQDRDGAVCAIVFGNLSNPLILVSCLCVLLLCPSESFSARVFSSVWQGDGQSLQTREGAEGER